MGNDHAARNAAKKFKKRQRQEIGRDGKPTRERRKKNGPRRLCRGVCFKLPELSEKDKKWNGQPDYEDEEDDLEDKVMETVVTDASKKKTNKKRKAEDEGTDDGPRMSTEVKLLDPKILLEQAKAKTLSKLPSGASVASLDIFHPTIQSCMLSQGFVEPTPIQSACWNLAVSGKDVLGVAEPGSGKTLAYLLPGFVKLTEVKSHNTGASEDVASGPRMLVVLPTRELVMQVSTVCRAARGTTGLRVVHLYGGVPREGQIAQLQTNPDVIVATPGRLLDLFDSKDLRLDCLSYVVLDESDKMLSLGFKPQIERLYNVLVGSLKVAKTSEENAEVAAVGVNPKKKARKGKDNAEVEKTANESKGPSDQKKESGGPKVLPQVLLFTATLPDEVLATSSAWQRTGEDVATVKITTSAAAVSSTVTQVVHVCAEHKKPAKLLKHLNKIKEQGAALRNPPRVLIFCNRVKAVRFLHDSLAKEEFRTVMLHGQRSQAEREASIKDFRSGKAQILVATDVAARGLDVRALPYVINYDFPSRLETYIHRIGRTGRLAAYGHAYSFFTRNLAKLAKPLQDLLTAHGQKVDPNLVSLAEEWRSEEAEMRSAAAILNLPAAAAEDGEASDASVDADGKEDEGETAALNADGGAVAAGVKKAKKKLNVEEVPPAVPEDLMEGLGLPREEIPGSAVAGDNAEEKGVEGVAAGSSSAVGKKKDKVVAVLNLHDELIEQPIRSVPKLDLELDPSSKKQRKKARINDVVLVPSKQGGAEQKTCQSDSEPPKANGADKTKAVSAKGTKVSSPVVKDASENPVAAVVAFLPSKKFTGSKPGMVFQKGNLGLGYYRDAVLVAKLAKAASDAKEPRSPALKLAMEKASAAGSAAAASASAVQIKKTSVGVAATKENGAAKAAKAKAPANRNKPIVPAHTGDTDSECDDEDDGWGALAAEAKSLSSSSKKATSVVDKKRKVMVNSAGNADDEDGDDVSAASSEPAKRKSAATKKALPGRLRKALAKRATASA